MEVQPIFIALRHDLMQKNCAIHLGVHAAALVSATGQAQFASKERNIILTKTPVVNEKRVQRFCAIMAQHQSTLVFRENLPQGQDFRSSLQDGYNCISFNSRKFDFQHILGRSVVFGVGPANHGCNVQNRLAEVIQEAIFTRSLIPRTRILHAESFCSAQVAWQRNNTLRPMI